MDGNQTSVLSRRRFLVTGVTAAGGFAIGIGRSPAMGPGGHGRRASLGRQPLGTERDSTRGS